MREFDLVVRARRRLSLPLAVLAFGFYLGFELLHVPPMLAVLAAAVFFFGSHVLRRATGSKAPRRFRVGPEGLYEGNELFLPRQQIAGGYVQPHRDGPPSVRLLDPAGRRVLEAKMANDETATDFLHALRVGTSPGATVFRVPSPLGSRWSGLAAGLVYVIAASIPSMPMLLALLLAAPILVLAVWPRKVAVGSDGLHLEWLGSSRFLPYRDLVTAVRSKRGVWLEVREGKSIEIATRGRSGGPVDQREALVARITEAKEQYAHGEARREAAVRLARGTRSARDWMRSLRSVAEGEGYREAALPADDLWRIVEDPSIEESARVGAAVALRAGLDDDGRSRLRVAAQATAAPKVRVALETAAEGKEEELEGALEALGEEERSETSS